MFVIAFRANNRGYVGQWWFVAAYADNEAGAANDAVFNVKAHIGENCDVICFKWDWAA